MEYLIQKLDNRMKNIQNTRLAINSIYDIRDLIENKKDMLKHFFDIEDDILQGTNALKALLAQNKDFGDRIIILQGRYNGLESKLVKDGKVIDELADRNSELINQIDEYKKIISELREQNAYLSERNYYLESELNNKEKEINFYINNQNKSAEKIDKISEENSLLRMKLERLKEEGVYRTINQEQFDEHNKFNKSNRSEEYEKLKNILNERENNRKIINEKIKFHLNEREKNVEDDKANLDDQNNINHSKKISSGIERTNSDEMMMKEADNLMRTSSLSHKTYSIINPEEEVQVEHADNNAKDHSSHVMHADNDHRSDLLNKIKNKADLVSQLVLKAVSSPEKLNLLNEKFGSDFMQRLLSNNVDSDFISQIEHTLKKFERHDKNVRFQKPHHSKKLSIYSDDYTSNNINTVIPETEEREEYVPESYRYKSNSNANKSTIRSSRSFHNSRYKNNSMSRSYSNTTKAYKPTTEVFGNNFEVSLRNYKPTTPSYKKNFINYTNPYGRYFDKDLQLGGNSKVLSKN
jgi:hypothetical protein